MAKGFIEYLQRERERLTQELLRARSHGSYAVSLEKLHEIVNDQIQRWSRDLADDRQVS